LSSLATKMQATIFGASCVELARLKHTKKSFGMGASPCKIWRMDDFLNVEAKMDEVVDLGPV
jgi:hypothetical protein